MERNTMADNKLFFGELEFTNLIKVLIRAYRYRNKNKNPEAVVIPDIREVDGVKVEFPTGEVIEKPKRGASKPSSNNS